MLPPPVPPPPPVTTPPASTPAGISPLGWVGLLGCAAGVAGSFMAWITLSSGFGSASVAGTEGDGQLTAGIGVVAGLLALLGLSKGARGMVIAAIVLAAVGAAMGVYEWQHVSSKIDDADFGDVATASVGSGIWVMLAGFVVAVVCLASSVPSKPSVAHS